jgi:protein-S-isoprenylcysteine O-methyltransferase Ste14
MTFPKPYGDLVQRLRVPSGFLLIVAFVLLAVPTGLSIAAGAPLCAAGLALRSWAAGHLRKNSRLTTSGPYAWHRNPLYAGTLLAASGCAVAGGSAALFLIVAGVFLLVYLPVMQLEEQHLATLFPEFQAYARRVPQLLPRRPAGPSQQRFEWAVWRANKEWKGVAAFGLLFAALVVRSLLAGSL